VIRVGCSGWSYDSWVGPFYPADLSDGARLAHYASVFDTVEVNATHYHTPTEPAVLAWKTAVPADFRFAVKAHRFGTHRKKLLDPASWVPRTVDPIRPLGRRRGPMLVQLPPRWRPELERLDHALALFRKQHAGKLAVEVRDPRWLSDDLRAVLRRHRVALCHHDLLAMDGLSDPTAPFVYVRCHGPNPDHPYHGSYPNSSLRSLAARLVELDHEGTSSYVYFNNDVDAAAPKDALRLRSLLA
jgi:uncharacterized protein YecE (DUF72 family)